MYCTRCGEELPENVAVCPACGEPVSPEIPEKPEIEYEELLTDFDDFLGQDPFGQAENEQPAPPPEPQPQSAAPSPASPEPQPQPAAPPEPLPEPQPRPLTPEEAAAERRAKIKARKKRSRRRRWRRFLRFLIVLAILAGLAAFAWFRLLPKWYAARHPADTGTSSCNGLAAAYLEAVQLSDEEEREEALSLCILPETREEEEQTTIFYDSWTDSYGKVVTDYAMGTVQLLDLSGSQQDVTTIQEASGLAVQEVVLIPVSVNYDDGTSAQMTLKAVQSEEGYYLIGVE